MIHFFKYALLNEWRTQYPNKKYLGALFISSFLTLWTYQLTAKALNPLMQSSLDWHGSDYFTFIVLGEAALMLPLGSLEGFTRTTRFLLQHKLLEDFLFAQNGLKKLILLNSTQMLQDVLHLFVFVSLAMVFFGFAQNFSTLLLALFWIVASIPLFGAMGILASYVVMITGRGSGVIGQINFLFSICAGVYFPLGVFSSPTREYLLMLVPTTRLLDVVRQSCGSGIEQKLAIQTFAFFVLMGGLAFGLCFILFPLVRQTVRRQGVPQLLQG